MLLIAAALLTASMHSLGVVEAPGVPPSAAHVVAASATVPPSSAHVVAASATAGASSTRAADGVHGAGATNRTSASEARALADADGSDFLTRLVRLDAPELRAVSGDADVVTRVQDDPPSATDTATWWAGLDDDQRERLERHAPVVVGCLDGVPYDVRDRANRAVLAAGLADHGASAAETAMLGQVQRSLVAAPGAPYRSLVTLDTRGSGRAAIAIGDLGTAADVSVVVPGMFFTVTGQMVDFTDTADDLYSEQATLAPLGQRADTSGGRSGVAVVAWMGYHTPDLSNILSLDLARTGAERLERTVSGIRSVRPDDQPRLNVVAHSYGSTMAMMALASGHMRADSLTVLGSPGSSVHSAGELAVASGEVFVGDAHSDPIAGTGYFGTDPGASSFGSTLLDLDPGTGVQTLGDVLRRPVGHNDYLKPGTASLHDVALIGIGRGDLVREQVRRGGGRGNGVVQASPDMYLVRPQDLHPRD